MATKYFTPEFRADANYTLDYNHPKDDSLGGSTETFRADEWQLEQISVGGDIHINNVRGRILTMDGLFATTTPRNDASTSRGQWDLSGAYKAVLDACLPDATQVADPFHVIKLANERVDETRRRIQNEIVVAAGLAKGGGAT